MAERMGIDRDIALIEMTGVQYHADQITTARALPALERAKKNGLDITAGTSIHHPHTERVGRCRLSYLLQNQAAFAE